MSNIDQLCGDRVCIKIAIGTLSYVSVFLWELFATALNAGLLNDVKH